MSDEAPLQTALKAISARVDLAVHAVESGDRQTALAVLGQLQRALPRPTPSNMRAAIAAALDCAE